jgi:UDP-N-acetyl-D-galactosamine dehydrogenase
MNSLHEKRIAVVGLGYVGLPLAVEFSQKYPTTGFDIQSSRIRELKHGQDRTLEISGEYLNETLAKGLLQFSDDVTDIADATIYIITVPTPTDRFNRPLLHPLISASESVGSVLKKGDIVIYESTVYPGVTEDECVPVLEKVSGLKYNTDFFAGYSPERINPGDKDHTLTKILKVTSGSTPEIAQVIDQLYRSIITAGTHLAPSIRVAEAAKVIENSQRDLNIAFVNELAKIFNIIGIDTHDVLEAAGTKWNFLKFKPGLVGGHCIGVDPYYLAQKAQEVGYHPEIILAGRRLNDGMGRYVAQELIRHMIRRDIGVRNANILILGFTFKENCPDVRNTRVIDIVNELKEYQCNVSICDPWASREEVLYEYGLEINDCVPDRTFDAVMLAVAHDDFKTFRIEDHCRPGAVIYDLKGLFPAEMVDSRL